MELGGEFEIGVNLEWQRFAERQDLRVATLVVYSASIPGPRSYLGEEWNLRSPPVAH